MSVKEQVIKEIKSLSESELEEVAKHLAFLKFRARHTLPTFDEKKLAALYAEFADEDRAMAEGDYSSL